MKIKTRKITRMTKRITISYDPDSNADKIIEHWKKEGYNLSHKIGLAILNYGIGDLWESKACSTDSTKEA